MRALIKHPQPEEAELPFSYNYTNEITDSEIIINKLCSTWYYR
jgi:hypothetical protein